MQPVINTYQNLRKLVYHNFGFKLPSREPTQIVEFLDKYGSLGAVWRPKKECKTSHGMLKYSDVMYDDRGFPTSSFGNCGILWVNESFIENDELLMMTVESKMKETPYHTITKVI